MKGEKLVGRIVDIKRNQEHYGGHWGVVVAFDGRRYTVSGGSIGDDLGPVFDRSEFTVRRVRRRRRK
jgi:hypothetical protein